MWGKACNFTFESVSPSLSHAVSINHLLSRCLTSLHTSLSLRSFANVWSKWKWESDLLLGLDFPFCMAHKIWRTFHSDEFWEMSSSPSFPIQLAVRLPGEKMNFCPLKLFQRQTNGLRSNESFGLALFFELFPCPLTWSYRYTREDLAMSSKGRK